MGKSNKAGEWKKAREIRQRDKGRIIRKTRKERKRDTRN